MPKTNLGHVYMIISLDQAWVTYDELGPVHSPLLVALSIGEARFSKKKKKEYR